MNAEMEKLYKLIGQSLAGLIPEAWKSAWVTVEFGEGVITAKGFYIPESGGEPRSLKLNYAFVKFFKSLRALMAKVPKGDWKQARFDLKRDGKFDFSFKYD